MAAVPDAGDDVPERTTKRVTGTFSAVFHGDYIETGDVPEYLRQWLDSGLDDRDDLRTWSFDVTA